MKILEFYTVSSSLPRDGLKVHAQRVDGVRAICGAAGVSFNVNDRYRLTGDTFERGDFDQELWTLVKENPITCPKCSAKLAPVLDEYKKPIPTEVGEYRYMGHFIQDQREYNNLPPWVSIGDTKDAEYISHQRFADAKEWCKENRIDNPDTQVSDYI